MGSENGKAAAVERSIAPAPRLALRTHEVAQSLGISGHKAGELIRSGEIRSFRLGDIPLVPVEALQDFIRKRMIQDNDTIEARERRSRNGSD